MSLVTVSRDDAVAIVTLNRPEAMNALSAALRVELADALAALDGDDSVRAIVLTGAGERAFTAGLDLKELGEAGWPPPMIREPAAIRPKRLRRAANP